MALEGSGLDPVGVVTAGLNAWGLNATGPVIASLNDMDNNAVAEVGLGTAALISDGLNGDGLSADDGDMAEECDDDVEGPRAR